MKTLKQYSKKLSDYIFESVGDIRGYPDLNLVTIEAVKEWLMQKRQELKCDTEVTELCSCVPKRVLLDELLEELEK